MGLSRRAFVRRVVAAVLGVALSRTLPGIAPTPLAWHPDALGISTQMLGSYDTQVGQWATRFDVLFGVGTWQPNQVVRIDA